MPVELHHAEGADSGSAVKKMMTTNRKKITETLVLFISPAYLVQTRILS